MADEKKRILIVEDEADIAAMIKMRLEAAGYEVIVAEDGNTGYAKARSESPNLIILDLMLPGMDGHKVCRLLKFDYKYKNIPIIILTAKGQKEDREISQQVGADFYLNKPVDFKELTAKVAEFLAKG